jgi:hypothetical protein
MRTARMAREAPYITITREQRGYVFRSPAPLPGVRFERDEVVLAQTQRWWIEAFSNVREMLIEEGLLEALPDGTPVWRCYENRFWATLAAKLGHGCYEVDGADEERGRTSAREAKPAQDPFGGKCCPLQHRGVTHKGFEELAVRLRRAYHQTGSYRAAVHRVKDGPKDWRTAKKWVEVLDVLEAHREMPLSAG